MEFICLADIYDFFFFTVKLPSVSTVPL